MNLDKNSIFATGWRQFYCLKPFQFDPLGKKYGLEIEKRIKDMDFEISHETVFTYLNHYASIGIIKKDKIGRQTFFSLIAGNAFPILSLLEQDRTALFMKQSRQAMLLAELSETISNCEFALLFGSAARKEERRSSDIDILMVNGKVDQNIISKKEALYGIKISIHTISLKELCARWHKEPAYIGLWKDRIVLNNFHNFWRFALKEGKA